MDIATIAELGTAAGTLLLGIATFGATRSANRSARIAERALLVGLRPVLTPARPEDPDQDVIFGDGRTVHVRSGYAAVEVVDEIVYLAIPLRNVARSSTWRSRCGTSAPASPCCSATTC